MSVKIEKPVSKFEDFDDEVQAGTLHLCDSCSFQTDDLEEFIEHLETSFPHQLTCLVCPEKFPRKVSLRKHYQEAHGYASAMKTIACDVCKFRAPCKEIILQHKFDKHVVNVYSCINCDSSYNHSLEFLDHMRTHSDLLSLKTGQKIEKREDKYLECNECDYKSNVKANMQRHKMKHHSNKFNCKAVGCNFKGLNNSDLLRHTVKIHRNEKRRLVPVKPKDLSPKETVAYICDACFCVLPSVDALMLHKKNSH